MDVKRLIPQNKFDESGVSRLKQLSYEHLEPIIPELLEWLQDGNWPVARSIADVLKPFTDKLIPQISAILQSNNTMWKFYILTIFCRNTTNPLLLHEIERIANHPTKYEIEDDVNSEAIAILNGEYK